MNNTSITPKVGMPFTRHIGSDSYAGVITRVSASGKTAWGFETGFVQAKEVKIWKGKRGWVSTTERSQYQAPTDLNVSAPYLDPNF